MYALALIICNYTGFPQTGYIARDQIGIKCSIIMRLHVTKHDDDSIQHNNVASDVEGGG